jgi:hypothetical protein
VKAFTVRDPLRGYLLLMPSANAQRQGESTPPDTGDMIMNFRLSLLGAAAMTAFLAQNAAHAENERVLGGCDASTVQQVQCVFERNGIIAPKDLRENDSDHRGDKEPRGGGNDDGKKNDGGGAGGNGGGNGGGEGGEGGS